MKRYGLMFFFSIVFLWTSLGGVVSASPSANFSVAPVIPENQVNQSSSYFDIDMNPGDRQTLEVILRNDTNEEVIVSQFVNTAITNSNGVIEYGPNDLEDDNTLVHSFADIAKMDDEITLAPNSTQTVSVDIALPNGPFEGTLLGGLYFQEKEKGEEEAEQGIQINHKIAYVIGILISVGNANNIQPELTLNDVQPTQINLRNVVTANIQNIKAAPIRNLIVDAKIHKKGSNKILHEVKTENMKMAPNSNFDFPISWEEQEFKDGTYVLELEARADGKLSSWTREFEIENSKELNEEAIIAPKEINYTTIGIIALVGANAIMWILKFRQKKGAQ